MKKLAKVIFTILTLSLVLSGSAFAKTKSVCPDGEHVWGPWNTYKEATFTNTGLKDRECLVCGYSEDVVIPVKTMNAKQKKVNDAFETYMKWAKKYNVNKMSKCFKDPKDAKSKYHTWTYMKKMYRKYNAYYLNYEVISIKVNSKKATLKVKITGPSNYGEFLFAADDTISYGYLHPGISDSKLLSYYKKRIKYWCDDGTIYNENAKRTVTVNYVKVAGTWKIKSPTNDIVDIAEMQYNKAFNKAIKIHYIKNGSIIVLK